MSKLPSCSGKPHGPFTPQYHQTRVIEEFLRTNKRGLAFWHELGTGKTCAMYGAVDAYRETRKVPVYIFAPASLAGTHHHQYCDVCGGDPDNYSSTFTFYSYNDRQGIVKKIPKDMNGSIIVIDEFQDVLNGKANRSATLSAVYDAVLMARGCRVILLSGTPIFTEYQAALLLNLLEPGIVPMDETAFLANIANDDYLAQKCQGLLSHVPIPSYELYPRRILPDIVDTIEMSSFQFSAYKEVREKELEQVKVKEEEIRRALARGNRKRAKGLQAQRFIQLTKLHSRKICNFAYPDKIVREGKGDMNAKWILDDENDAHVEGLKEYSPKMARLVHRLLTIPNKHMVFGWFKSNCGLQLIYTYLVHCGLEPLIFSGDLSNDEKRTQVIDAFNHPDNSRGEKHKVILVSGAGAMGISLFCIRSMHIFEASLNEFTTVQAIGRGFRTGSHMQLPIEERTVQVYRYFTSLPVDPETKEIKGRAGKTFPEILSTEEQMYESGMKKKRAVQRVLDIMARASFDCREPYNHMNGTDLKCYDFDEKDEDLAIEDFDGQDFDDFVESDDEKGDDNEKDSLEEKGSDEDGDDLK